MINYFQNRFGLSKKGAKDLRFAIVTHTFLNLSFMLPIIIVMFFLQEYIGVLFSDKTSTYSILFYIFFALISFIVMYVIARVDYNSTYTKIYNESAKNRINLAETLRQLPMSFFGKKDIADLSSTIMEDATQIEQIFSHAVPQLYASFISMAIMTTMMFFYNWQMSLALFWVVPIGFLVFKLSKGVMERDHRKIYEEKRVISNKIQEGMDMVQEIKSYSQEENYLNDLNTTLDYYENDLIKSELLGGSLINLSHFMLKLGFPTVIFAGAYLLSQGGITLFTYIVFLVIVGRIYDPITEVMNNFAMLLYLDVRIKRLKDLNEMPRQSGKKDFTPKNFDIEFKNVNFSYQDGIQTLKDVNFTAKQGEVTALIGPSGGGKTTTAKLSARFWDIDSGKITIGGEDISKFDPEALLSSFSIVFQDVTLFNSSIMENIRLGKKDATDSEVKKAAKLANCDEFIEKLPNGYNTLIGENVERISGGERQRISIARALLKDAPIILLDEATASLDAENESKIQRGISELIKNKTVLIIAHRMRTVIAANKIIALKEGKVVECGTPEELKKRNGLFAKMLNKQKV
ncbi:MAG: ABC transporter ATP-binding protein [Candidatus Cloacimonadota bacterium]|nr:MAG: ABC transporter ATP-binding protein [Candidatus Cloacimonadota bacterium]PIE80171.1 MAG: ABC transporter ATP-binding protein [Candidatus Delongbacteria bacterium]